MPVPAVETPGSRLTELNRQTNIFLQAHVLEAIRDADIRVVLSSSVVAVHSQENVGSSHDETVASAVCEVDPVDLVQSVTTCRERKTQNVRRSSSIAPQSEETETGTTATYGARQRNWRRARMGERSAYLTC